MAKIVAVLIAAGTLGVQMAVAQAPLRARSVAFTQPAQVAALDMGKLKGEPARLSWSPDGRQLYLQTLEGRFGQPNAKLRHYVLALADGSTKDLDAEPGWASQYWTMKSAQSSPDDPTLKIELKTEQRRQRTTSAAMGGDLARGAPVTGDVGASAGDAGAAAFGAQSVTAHVMRLKGATIGEFINSVIVPGLTFGWGPKGSRAIAYIDEKDGRVIVMDAEGDRRDVSGSGNALLPAWAPDGTRLAWLQQDGRRTFVLQVVNVSTS